MTNARAPRAAGDERPAGLLRDAGRAGIATDYLDQTGRARRPSAATLEAILGAMGAAGPPPPGYRVVTPEAPPDIAPAGTWRLDLEDGTVRRGRGPLPALPIGRHRLVAGDETLWLLCAPPALPLPARGWGITLPLYGLRGPGRGGLADYGDLAAAVAGLGRAGAGFVGTNPIHAGFGWDATRISPYSPSHRRRLSVAHIAAPDEPEGPPGLLVDYAAALPARAAALEAAFAAEDDTPEFRAFLAREGAGLRRFAIYQALAERFGPTWDRWPAELQDPDSAAVATEATADRVAFHAWLQFRADRQLAGVAAAAREANMAQGLYLDLAVGTHPFGAETWAERRVFAAGVSLGAPPDAFAETGQVWNVAPFNPLALRETGFAALAGTVRAQLRYAGMLRIDHILGFERAYWVAGSTGEGSYVAMPRDALLAVVRIEAARAGAVIVGEDLGNIPAGLQEALAGAGILGCRVAMFEGGRGAADYPEQVLASFGTHDLPTWEGWRRGRDIDARAALGPLDTASARTARCAEVAALDAARQGADITEFLAATPARLVALQIEDILGLPDQANLPGTVDEYPNWRRRLPVDAGDLGRDPRVRAAARAMTAAGR